MVWFKIDDKLHEHSKAHRAGVEAIGLWALAGSYCGDNENDGFVPERVLTRWVPTAAKGKRLAQRLVDVALWLPGELDGERGWWFHDWKEFQPTAAEIADKRRKKAEAGRLGGLASGQTRREASAKAGASQVVEANANPDPTRPVPDPLSVVTYVEPSSTQREPIGLEGHELQKVALMTGGDMAHAEKVARNILATAGGPVRAPLRYVMAAIRDNPDAHRFRRGNPTKETACPQHPGEWADNCRIHASEGA